MASSVRPSSVEKPPAFADAILHAQEKLARAEQIAGLTGDPMQPVLSAQSAFLGSLHEAAADIREAVSSGARGLTPQGEADLIQRLSERGIYTLDRSVSRFAAGFNLRSAAWSGLVFAVWSAVLVFATLYVSGRMSDRMVVNSSDTAAVNQYCNEHTTRYTDGSARCSMPDLSFRASLSK